MNNREGEKDLFSLWKEGDVHQQSFMDLPQPSKNFFSLLIDRIKKTLQPTPNEDRNLSGRVQQLSQTALAVMQKLKDIKTLLKKSLTPELFGYVEALMEPLTRDVAGIQKLLIQTGSVVHQAKAFKKYSNWMIKAELWIELEKKAHDMEAIVEAMIKHVMHEADEQIEQDLQVIRDYEECVLESLPLNDEEVVELKKHLTKEVRLQMLGLEDLKDKPAIKSLQEVLVWKNNVDKKRLKFFEKSLQIIDEIIHAVSPSSSSEEEHEYLVEVLTQIVFLEEEIPGLLSEVGEACLLDPVKKNMIASKIQSFEQELHELNLNLRLTPELVDRLQALLATLQVISEKMDQ